ncbi:hypothetical protein SASPL_110025 [Salvia splendens]|uniref:Mediator of RNA polymerase II transcription subunit 31 n=1 Tax=Salvia splendens TaxID=180675 RepID=A0A8X8Y3W4_SALSN|nr:hypothetical protein SASPL_110025 [Salvia splendens]
MESDPMEVANPPSPPTNVYKDPDDGRQRFLLELEFVQCLANPTYIHCAQLLHFLPILVRTEFLAWAVSYRWILLFDFCLHSGADLAQNRYFEDEAFIGYLKYLQYWQRPEYLKFIMYPHCLFFLELLQNANFRNAMAHPANKVLHYGLLNFSPPALPPTTIPASASSIPPAPPQAPSPMQYGSTFVKNDLRSSGVEKRKRK